LLDYGADPARAVTTDAAILLQWAGKGAPDSADIGE
jgi:hypothetical protein